MSSSSLLDGPMGHLRDTPLPSADRSCNFGVTATLQITCSSAESYMTFLLLPWKMFFYSFEVKIILSVADRKGRFIDLGHEYHCFFKIIL